MRRAVDGSVAALLLLAAACEPATGVWRSQRLPSGRVLEVTSAQLVWGDDHGERLRDQDCFQLAYVIAEASASQAARDQEAVEGFELIRATSEVWGFDHATLVAYPRRPPSRSFDLYVFRREPGAGWRWTRTPIAPPQS